MKTNFSHIQVNIDFEKNHGFYKEFMTFLGWNVVFETNGIIGFTSGQNGDIWFIDSKKKETMDYDMIGVNHIGIKVDTQDNLDKCIIFLKSKGINGLFDTPRHRPEFVQKPDETYYQIIFETPDKAQFELVYVGKK
jgi:catechol 2,3-dioxygenase-like lactoylglutathione lyase family enzyme